VPSNITLAPSFAPLVLRWPSSPRAILALYHHLNLTFQVSLLLRAAALVSGGHLTTRWRLSPFLGSLFSPHTVYKRSIRSSSFSILHASFFWYDTQYLTPVSCADLRAARAHTGTSDHSLHALLRVVCRCFCNAPAVPAPSSAGLYGALAFYISAATDILTGIASARTAVGWTVYSWRPGVAARIACPTCTTRKKYSSFPRSGASPFTLPDWNRQALEIPFYRYSRLPADGKRAFGVPNAVWRYAGVPSRIARGGDALSRYVAAHKARRDRVCVRQRAEAAPGVARAVW
jgi:hypothetical protein